MSHLFQHFQSKELLRCSQDSLGCCPTTLWEALSQPDWKADSCHFYPLGSHSAFWGWWRRGAFLLDNSFIVWRQLTSLTFVLCLPRLGARSLHFSLVVCSKLSASCHAPGRLCPFYTHAARMPGPSSTGAFISGRRSDSFSEELPEGRAEARRSLSGVPGTG